MATHVIPVPEDERLRKRWPVLGGTMYRRVYQAPHDTAEALADSNFARGTLLSGESGPGGARINSVTVDRHPGESVSRIVVQYHKHTERV